MDNISQFFEFPVTIPNQRKVDQVITAATIINGIVSISVGLYTDSLFNLYLAFGVQFVLLILIISPNWLFKSEPNLEWLKIKI